MFKNPSFRKEEKATTKSDAGRKTTTKKRPVKKSKMIEVAEIQHSKIHGDEKGEGTHATCEHGFIHAVVGRAQKLEQELKRLGGASGGAVGFFSQTSLITPGRGKAREIEAHAEK